MPAQPPSLKSVASAAGVSTAAVSYAFNRPDRLSAQARTHILAVARELGYAGPDAAARSLQTVGPTRSASSSLSGSRTRSPTRTCSRCSAA